MKKLTFISCLLLSGCLAGAMAANKKQPIYKDAKAPIEERVNDLVSRMTLEEKVQQLNQYTLGRNNNENNRGEKVKKIPATLGSLIYRAQNEAYKSGRPSTGVNGLLFSWLHCSAANGDAKRNV